MAPVDSRDYVLSGIYYSVLLLVYTPSKHDVDQMLAQHQTSTGSTPRVCWAAFNPANTKHLYNICTMRRRRWAGAAQMLYKCLVFTRNSSWSGGDYKPTPTQCL